MKYIVGTGGVIIYDRHAYDILKSALYDAGKPTELRPRKPAFLLDGDYLTSAMGLLGRHHPEIALRIMKKRFRKIVGNDYESAK